MLDLALKYKVHDPRAPYSQKTPYVKSYGSLCLTLLSWQSTDFRIKILQKLLLSSITLPKLSHHSLLFLWFVFLSPASSTPQNSFQFTLSTTSTHRTPILTLQLVYFFFFNVTFSLLLETFHLQTSFTPSVEMWFLQKMLHICVCVYIKQHILNIYIMYILYLYNYIIYYIIYNLYII